MGLSHLHLECMFQCRRGSYALINHCIALIKAGVNGQRKDKLSSLIHPSGRELEAGKDIFVVIL